MLGLRPSTAAGREVKMNCLEYRRSDSTNNNEEEIIADDRFVGGQ
jgi:hypothetical protein